MKRLMNILSVVAVLLMLTACYKEDKLVVEPEKVRFNLADDPNNPLQHYIHTLYRDYGTILITDPQLIDYRFNFKFSNDLLITPPEQNRALLIEATKFIDEMLVKIYTESFRKKYFPFTIILASKMTKKNGEGNFPVFGSSNFFAISGIDETISTLTMEEKKELKGLINGAFFGSLSADRRLFSIPKEFDLISPVQGKPNGYGTMLWDEPKDKSELYKGGFTDRDSVEDYAYIFPTTTQEDRKLWLQFIFKTTASEMASICNTYPKMKQKYDILKKALLELDIKVEDIAPKE